MSVIDGKTGRARFLLTIVLLFTGCVILGFLVPRFHENALFLVVLCGYVFLVVPVAFFIFFIRRLNDAAKPFIWVLLLLVPIANLIVILYMLLQPGKQGSEQRDASSG